MVSLPNVKYSNRFVTAYNTLPPHIQRKVDKQLQQLAAKSPSPGLRLKKMFGDTNVWEGRVDYHYRFTFERLENGIRLRAVGMHDILSRP